MTNSAANHPLIPSSFAAVDAILRAVITTWHRLEEGVTDWDSCLETIELTENEGWALTTEKLQLINTFQWHEEDKSRAHGAGDMVLGAIKRSIDASNRRRVQTVDRLDDQIYTGLREAGSLKADAPLHSESPGSIIDRLTVLALKTYHVSEAHDALAAGSADADAMQGRLDTLTEQYADLGVCLDRLLVGIGASETGLKLYRPVKLYKDPKTGQMRADLDE
jgi:hypothetical protein